MILVINRFLIKGHFISESPIFAEQDDIYILIFLLLMVGL